MQGATVYTVAPIFSLFRLGDDTVDILVYEFPIQYAMIGEKGGIAVDLYSDIESSRGLCGGIGCAAIRNGEPMHSGGCSIWGQGYQCVPCSASIGNQNHSIGFRSWIYRTSIGTGAAGYGDTDPFYCCIRRHDPD